MEREAGRLWACQAMWRAGGSRVMIGGLSASLGIRQNSSRLIHGLLSSLHDTDPALPSLMPRVLAVSLWG